MYFLICMFSIYTQDSHPKTLFLFLFGRPRCEQWLVDPDCLECLRGQFSVSKACWGCVAWKLGRHLYNSIGRVERWSVDRSFFPWRKDPWEEWYMYLHGWLIFMGFRVGKNMDQSHGSVVGKPNERLKILLEVFTCSWASKPAYPSLPPRNKKAAFKKGGIENVWDDDGQKYSWKDNDLDGLLGGCWRLCVFSFPLKKSHMIHM